MRTPIATDIQMYHEAIREEERRTSQFLHLTANETVMSRTARAFGQSVLGDYYFMGGGDADEIVDFQPFTFRGISSIAAIVKAAEDAAKDMLHAADVNLKCLSGVHAMTCALLSTTEPGDTVMSVALEHGGHFATQVILGRTGRRHIPTSYNYETLSFDAARLADDYHAAGAKALYMDVSFYLNPHNLREIRAALGENATIIYDASHTMGLIMGGRFQSPLQEGANVVCGNTHKTLPGPQKGMIAFRDSTLADRANLIINSGLYSSSHTSSMIALATTILEMRCFGEQYATQIITNSNALGDALEGHGLAVRRANTGRYSENHQVHVLSADLGFYRDLYIWLRGNNISVNFDKALGAGSYIRLGTQQVTRRGMKEEAMVRIAELLAASLQKRDVRAAVVSLVNEFPDVRYSFDDWNRWNEHSSVVRGDS